MYLKDLNNAIRLRVSDVDMEFLRMVSEERNVSISQVIRDVIGDYRRGYNTLSAIEKALKDVKEKEGEAVHGDTKPDCNDLLL